MQDVIFTNLNLCDISKLDNSTKLELKAKKKRHQKDLVTRGAVEVFASFKRDRKITYKLLANCSKISQKPVH